MVICDRQGEQLLLTLSPEGVRFLREQWSWLRELVRWQLAGCTDDPLAQVTGLPVPIGSIDGRAWVLHAGTRRRDDGAVVSAGGRVLSVVGTGVDLAAARAQAYHRVEQVHLPGGHYRSDIGSCATRREDGPSAGA